MWNTMHTNGKNTWNQALREKYVKFIYQFILKKM